MNNKNISELLTKSMKELNMLPEVLETGKTYTIVEFCQQHLKLSEDATINLIY